MEKSIKNARADIQKALKKTCQVLNDYADDPKMKQLIVIKPQAAVAVQMKPYVKEYFQIDIFGKLQPVIIRLTGTKDDFAVYASTSDKYPEETSCQQTFKNTRKIEFYINGNKDQ